MKDHYWLEVDPETGNPTGQVCWAYYGLSDKPRVGHWILVKKTELPQEAKTYCKDCGVVTEPGVGSARCPSCWEDRCGH